MSSSFDIIARTRRSRRRSGACFDWRFPKNSSDDSTPVGLNSVGPSSSAWRIASPTALGQVFSIASSDAASASKCRRLYADGDTCLTAFSKSTLRKSHTSIALIAFAIWSAFIAGADPRIVGGNPSAPPPPKVDASSPMRYAARAPAPNSRGTMRPVLGSQAQGTQASPSRDAAGCASPRIS